MPVIAPQTQQPKTPEVSKAPETPAPEAPAKESAKLVIRDYKSAQVRSLLTYIESQYKSEHVTKALADRISSEHGRMAKLLGNDSNAWIDAGKSISAEGKRKAKVKHDSIALLDNWMLSLCAWYDGVLALAKLVYGKELPEYWRTNIQAPIPFVAEPFLKELVG